MKGKHKMNYLNQFAYGVCFGAGWILIAAAFSVAFHLSPLGQCTALAH